ncbi:MAG: S9 family peptidase [Prolixibacteraceae bacterium]|jgi:dipeptidyl aminopeptidase/acylaminoacyl peptidase|nr:S9 family peptidase [Prolixibacteraceae bacterium]MBT6765350.1 S9 family peptidase [Prolixibacteraceae bacterium]MBT6997544.1 S9 family peptidase [Prolixibacteraceae bacterium]MBT7394562.1 S9 family peptidase [Prolixibacteraceae bacterium]
MKKLITILFVFSFLSSFAQIQKNNKSKLTIEQIMQNPDKWIGTAPTGIFWSENGENIYFDWNPEMDTLSSLYSYSIKTKEIKKVPTDVKIKLPGKYGNYNIDKTLKVYTRNGNIFLLNIKKGIEKQLTNWLGRASSPEFVLNDSQISFSKDNNLFLINPETGLMQQITNFVSGEKRTDKKNTGQAKWLEEQQKDLFVVLNEREEMSKAQENRRELEETKQPEKIYLGKKRLGGTSLSPTGKFVIYSTYLSPQGTKSTSVTHHVTQSGYTEEKNARTKVGSTQTMVSMGVFNVDSNKIVSIKTDDIPGLKDQPDYLKDYPERILKDSSKIKNRAISLLGPVWNETEDLALIVALSRDNKDRWILLLNPLSGELNLLDRQRDEAWIGGPGIGGWGFSTGNIGWMPDGKSVWFHSEESGYSHLYAVNIETKKKTTLTASEFEVSEAFISNDKKHFFFTANKVHPGIKHFYKMPVWGGELSQITSTEGGNEITISPDEKHLAIRHSTANKPWELYLQENKAEEKVTQITNSTTQQFNSYEWRTPEYITFTAEDGAEVNARLFQPENPDKNGPAVIFVHGAGYLQNAHKWWSSYFREYQFHNFLVDNGYTVLDIDYRGSAGYGRDWRTGIYRHMGGKDLSDNVDGAKLLVEKYNISPDKIGLYGGSYGGFITLMAMFNHPDVFAAGGALRSVTDWAHYNHGYTANILNTPVEDSIAYVQSSPIYFAEGLEGALLMCHGMVDDNVQFQDIVRITQRFIELGKENWELAVYPVEAHGFREPSSWTDEYKRIFKLFEENLKK